MNNEIIPFDFNNNEVRVINQDGEPWFVAADVCRILEIKNTTQALGRLDADEKSMLNIGLSGGATNAVNESGLYTLVLASRKPEAKAFKRWVTHEVIPSIRRHGGYMAGQDHMTPEEMALASMRWLQSKVDEQARQLEAQAPKVLFADSVATSKTSILVGELAKILKGNGVEIGQNRLFAWLRDNGYLIKQRGEAWNSPTQYAMERGLFEVKESTHQQPDGTVRITRTTKVTGKGQQYFVNKLLTPVGA